MYKWWFDNPDMEFRKEHPSTNSWISWLQIQISKIHMRVVPGPVSQGSLHTLICFAGFKVSGLALHWPSWSNTLETLTIGAKEQYQLIFTLIQRCSKQLKDTLCESQRDSEIKLRTQIVFMPCTSDLQGQNKFRSKYSIFERSGSISKS